MCWRCRSVRVVIPAPAGSKRSGSSTSPSTKKPSRPLLFLLLLPRVGRTGRRQAATAAVRRGSRSGKERVGGWCATSAGSGGDLRPVDSGGGFVAVCCFLFLFRGECPACYKVSSNERAFASTFVSLALSFCLNYFLSPFFQTSPSPALPREPLGHHILTLPYLSSSPPNSARPSSSQSRDEEEGWR